MNAEPGSKGRTALGGLHPALDQLAAADWQCSAKPPMLTLCQSPFHLLRSDLLEADLLKILERRHAEGGSGARRRGA